MTDRFSKSTFAVCIVNNRGYGLVPALMTGSVCSGLNTGAGIPREVATTNSHYTSPLPIHPAPTRDGYNQRAAKLLFRLLGRKRQYY